MRRNNTKKLAYILIILLTTSQFFVTMSGLRTYGMKLDSEPDEVEYVWVNSSWKDYDIDDEIREGVIFGTNAFNNISSGISHVCSGGIVNVSRGNYKENLLIEHPLKLMGNEFHESRNIIIDGNKSGNVIHVLNTNSVELCNLTISKSGNDLSGVLIEASYNISMMNNILELNGCGILIDECLDIKIKSNNISQNYQSGIYLISKSALTKVNITNNSIFNNGEDGIHLKECNFNSISQNILHNNGGGILLQSGVGNNIHNNTINNNTKYGIKMIAGDLENSYNNNIDNNTIFGNRGHGIQLDFYCKFNNISNNTIFRNGISGILLEGSKNTNVTNNVIFNQPYGDGIFLVSAKNNIIKNNSILNNAGDGIKMINASAKNKILNGNKIEGNTYGISIEGGSGNRIINNLISYNDHFGIYLEYTLNTRVLKNTITNHEVGVNCNIMSIGNEIFYNEIHSNIIGIQHFIGSHGGIVNNNISKNSIGILSTLSLSGGIKNNICSNRLIEMISIVSFLLYPFNWWGNILWGSFSKVLNFGFTWCFPSLLDEIRING